jgi:putative ABC transport system permease protein
VGVCANPVRTSVTEVTPNYFEFFRWTPALGRGFTSDSAAAGSPAVVVLSYAFWQNVLAARADVVGSTVRLDAEPATIIGVLPRTPAVDGTRRRLGCCGTSRGTAHA